MAQTGVTQDGNIITIDGAYDVVYVQASFLQAGGTLNVKNASHVVILNDLSTTSSTLVAGTINIQGNAYVDSQVIMSGKGVSVNFSGDYSIMQFAKGQFTSGLTSYPVFSGFNATSKIMMSDLPNGTYRIGLSGATASSTANRLNFYSNITPGASLSIPFGTTISTNYSSDNHYETNGTVSFSQTQCFLPGSLIETTSGQVAVENLEIGDFVRVFGDQNDTVRMVVWTGQKTVLASENGFPVRIKAHAFAENEPATDLLLTGEHCLCFNNAFIPARMLVNGKSITQETQWDSYQVHHIELSRHSIIRANNLLCESYLDTGTRHSFVDVTKPDQNVAVFFPGIKTWEIDAALPLRTSRNFIEPIFKKLSARADKLGFDAEPKSPISVIEADLAIVTDKGITIRPTRVAGRTYTFLLPPDTSFLDIVSRTGRPSELIGPFIDDRRDLGVLVGKIVQFCPRKTVTLDAHLFEDKCLGWHDIETPSYRWTSGRGRVALASPAIADYSVLSLEIAATGVSIATQNTQIGKKSPGSAAA